MKEQSTIKHGGDVYTDGFLKGKELIDFSSNINPLGVPTSFIDRINEALQSVTRYPDIKYRELTRCINRYIKKQGNFKENFLNEDNYILGNGAAEVIDLVVSSLKKILIIVPSFVEYEEDAVKHNCEITYSYLTEDMDYNYEDIYSKLEAVDGLIIANPNNPSGNVINKDKFKNILDYCEENNKTIIIDEAFVEFTGDKNITFVKELEKYNCLFIIRALTKYFAMPGIRFGFGISKNSTLIQALKKKQNPWNINCFAETAAKYVLFDEEYIKASEKWIQDEKSFLPKELEKISFIERVYETHSNYVLCELNGITDEELYNLCLKEDIVIRKASNFRGLDESFVRFAIKDRELNIKLLDVLRNFKF